MTTDTTTAAPELLIADDDDTRFRFKVGKRVYVRGWLTQEPVIITRRLLHLSTVGIFSPHYLCADAEGKEWRIAQLELSSKPVEAR
jgi:hypothetical protein